MRLRLLREFLSYARAIPDLWIATGEQIAHHFERSEAIAAAEVPAAPSEAGTAAVESTAS
jgi:hypothetical protein